MKGARGLLREQRFKRGDAYGENDHLITIPHLLFIFLAPGTTTGRLVFWLWRISVNPGRDIRNVWVSSPAPSVALPAVGDSGRKSW